MKVLLFFTKLILEYLNYCSFLHQQHLHVAVQLDNGRDLHSVLYHDRDQRFSFESKS